MTTTDNGKQRQTAGKKAGKSRGDASNRSIEKRRVLREANRHAYFRTSDVFAQGAQKALERRLAALFSSVAHTLA